MNSLAVTVICLWLGLVYSMDFPVSGVNDSCTTMQPPGDKMAKNTSSPYKITVASVKYCASSSVKVTLEGAGDDDEEYKGVILQARCSAVNCTPSAEAIGMFSIDTTADKALFKLNQCHGNNDSTLTHKTDADKEENTFTWMPPEGFKDSIKFKATFVGEDGDFWENVMSPEVSFTTVQAECTVGGAMSSSVMSLSVMLISLLASLH